MFSSHGSLHLHRIVPLSLSLLCWIKLNFFFVGYKNERKEGIKNTKINPDKKTCCRLKLKEAVVYLQLSILFRLCRMMSWQVLWAHFYYRSTAYGMDVCFSHFIYIRSKKNKYTIFFGCLFHLFWKLLNNNFFIWPFMISSAVALTSTSN